jgi:hypothetical protein
MFMHSNVCTVRESNPRPCLIGEYSQHYAKSAVNNSVTVIRTKYIKLKKYITDSSDAFHPKSVNLALEASVILDPKDIDRYGGFLRNAKDVLDTLSMVFKPRKTQIDTVGKWTTRANENLFIDFLKKGSSIILKYDDRFLKNFLQTMYLETKTNYSILLSELLNPHFKDVLLKRLKQWALSPTKTFRDSLKQFHDNVETNTFAQRLNSFFGEKYAELFDKILVLLQNRRKKLIKTVQDILALIFDSLIRMTGEEKKRLAKEFHHAERKIDTKSKIDDEQADDDDESKTLYGFKLEVEKDFRRVVSEFNVKDNETEMHAEKRPIVKVNVTTTNATQAPTNTTVFEFY